MRHRLGAGLQQPDRQGTPLSCPTRLAWVTGQSGISQPEYAADSYSNGRTGRKHSEASAYDPRRWRGAESCGYWVARNFAKRYDQSGVTRLKPPVPSIEISR